MVVAISFLEAVSCSRQLIFGFVVVIGLCFVVEAW
jgi:hypothetical protein